MTSEYYEQKILKYELLQMKALQKEEENNPKRYALFPIKNKTAYEYYLRQEMIHWTTTELKFVEDRDQYDKSSDQIKKIFDTILAFFLVGDGLISDNISGRFLRECKDYESKAMFISQLHIELIHAETYGLAAFTFKRTEEAMAELMNSVQKTSCIMKKQNFMELWMLADNPRFERLVAFCCAEGIFFCTLFAVIFWFKSKNFFHNFITANEFIFRDESLHRNWGAHLFSQEVKHVKLSSISDKVYEIVRSAVEIEDEFVDYILDSELEDLNKTDLKTFARLITDNLLIQLGVEPIYNVKNPFSWFDSISLEGKHNFFEVDTGGGYQKSSLKELMNVEKRAGLIENKDTSFLNPEEENF